MKCKFRFLSILSLSILGLFFGCKNYSTKTETLEIKSEVFSKRISFSSQKPGPISVTIFNSDKEKIAATDKNSPLFEFGLNNEIITANDEVWIYNSHDIRKMGNNGHELVFLLQKQFVI